MPVQNNYTTHKFQNNSQTPVPGKMEIAGMKPSAAVVRNLMAYAAALLIIQTSSLGNLTFLLN